MTPYYSDELVTIYHGDSREWANLYQTSIDLTLTDPPYGIGYTTSASRTIKARATEHPPVVGDDQPFDPSPWLQGAGGVILWGANHYANRLPASPSWLVWDKRVRQGVGVNDSADCEMAWSNIGGPARLFRHMWNGMWRDTERGEHYHPTQKPVALMAWCIAQARLTAGSRILDPFMGAGPIAVAAKAAGHSYIGIEIEERYCEIAATRCSQEVLGLAV